MSAPLPDDGQAGAVARSLLDWYEREARPLRIRERRDAYAVLIVEVMAQQTQISRVDVLALRFLERFPTLESLAAAEAAEVIDAWRGLGYNRRAIALHAAARRAVELGGLPGDHEALMALPGIGPYTARAVSAIASGGRSIPVDVNVARVVQRLLGVPRLKPRELQAAADAFGAPVPVGRAGEWAQGAMDLASRLCRVADPLCGECPLREHCVSADRPFPAAPRARGSRPPFRATSRWLRGRLMDELRDAGADGVEIAGKRGDHDEEAVAAALAGLVREGLAERLGDGRHRLPRG